MLHTKHHRMEVVFVLMVFTIFAAVMFMLVLIGAKQYQTTADKMSQNYEIRTVTSYIEEKARQNACNGGLYISNIDGSCALAYNTISDEETYKTYIYYYEGSLRELTVTDKSVFSRDSGQKIIGLKGFEPKFVGRSLIRVDFTFTDGSTKSIFLDKSNI